MKKNKFLISQGKRYYSDWYRNSVVIVTGGAQGIGKSICLKFAKFGANIVIPDIDEQAGIETVNEINNLNKGQAIFIKSDVSKESDAENITEKTLEKFGKINVLVNNAAIYIPKGLTANAKEMTDSFSVNVLGYHNVTKFAVKGLKETKYSSIVNIGSIGGYLGQSNYYAYNFTKAAVLQLTRNLALDLAKYNIRVNSVSPGAIDSPIQKNIAHILGKSLEERLAGEAKLSILQRCGTPEEVANAVVFLASPEASYITGTDLIVDGGVVTI